MKKSTKMLLSLFASVSLLAACGGNNETGESSEPTNESTVTQVGGTIKIGLAANPNSLDPTAYTGQYESNVIRQIGDTLVIYSDDFSEFKPSLATEWSVSEDGLTYTFSLRDDVKFQAGEYQDGRSMTAEDVKYSLERSAFDSALNRLSGVESVEVLGEYEVAIHLTSPSSALMAMLTDSGNIIVPKEEVEGWGDQFGQHLVGTGPFSLDTIQSGQQIDLKRNENYWGEAANLDGVIFKVITDANMMINSLLSGDIDLATDIRGQNREIIENANGVSLTSIPGFSTTYLDMNMMEGPTANEKVREAIYMATNVEEIVNGVNQWGGAEVSYSPLPKASWGYMENAEEFVPDYDPEAAKALLAETEYADGFSIDMYLSDARVPYATIFQDQMKTNLNIDVQIHPQEWGTYSETVSTGQASMNIGAWSWYPDPYFYLNQEFHSNSIGSLGNGRGYNNSEVDALLDSALSETDQEARTDLYQQALEIIMADYSRIELELSETANGISDKVVGYNVLANNSITLVNNEGTNVSLQGN
ncbi:MAG TPA: ABC transporter substrate-binding protein [Sporosarcina psychrophila]|uniref:ABC transporter substrate-binding protein n=2 Tax=Bacilli TaxID=91061 RepID=A0A3Q9BKU9_9LACT|nr:ABC transporter substrate-binding protein [Jeotgalibaca ciconiae]AZP04722.1 ABC transporter substrate-binding protein [Jeotgalibaca ciconiae]HJB23914.1 ABC transporter substrate-binding protein [Candidatus Jeotgalibaca pullicola]HJF30624.1 ABC transporter substrate-binding protein [Sporosarcina psychrophila]